MCSTLGAYLLALKSYMKVVFSFQFNVGEPVCSFKVYMYLRITLVLLKKIYMYLISTSVEIEAIAG